MKNLKKISSLLFNKTWPLLLIIFIVSIFFWKVFLKGFVPIPADFVVGVYYPWLDYKWGFPAGVPVKNPIMADVPSFIYPMQTLAVKMMKAGQWPLWNPYILSGNPLLANFQSAPFSPTNILYFFMSIPSALSIQIILQHFLAALSTYILLQHWKVSHIGSILGGVIYAFSGFNLIWSQWNGHTLSAAFIPLLLYFEDRFLSTRKAKFGVCLSFVLALQIYSGYPQVVIYTSIAMGILYLFRVLPDLKHNFKKVLVLTFLLFAFFLLGLGVSSPQWLPGKELLDNSQRAVEYHPFEWAFLPWDKIITFVAPDFYGNHATNNYWGPQDYTSNTGYVGIVSFVLVLISIKLFRKKEEVKFTLVIAVISLVLAFATPLSVFLWQGSFLGLGAASAHRSLVLWNLAVALLAGFALDSLELKSKFKGRLIPILLVIFLIGSFGLYAYFVRTKTIFGISVFVVAYRNLILPSAVLFILAFAIYLKLKLLVIFLSIVELFYFGWKFTPFVNRNLIFPTTPVLEYLMAQKKPFRVTGNKVIPMNMKMAYHLESPEGYDAVYPARMAKLLASLNDVSSSATFMNRYGFVDREDSPLLDLMNTKYFLALKLDSKGNPDKEGKKLLPVYTNPKFKNVFEDKSVVVLENINVLPRAFLVYDWEVINEDNSILDRLLNKDFPLDKKILLEEPVSINRFIDLKTPIASVEYIKYEEQESILKIDTDKEGFLFVSDSFYPGWRAYVDGTETKIYRADFAFRAIPVGAGSHEVRFLYSPDSFYNGVKISLLSFVALLFIGGGTYLVGKRKEGDYTSKCS